jgi:glycine/D-amino acid oxidase-like deaminating enzyme
MTNAYAADALAGAKPAVFWSDRDDAPECAPELRDSIGADLTIVGGGFTGLWSAIQALEDQPDLNVVVLEADRCGFGASSRNGGFCDASLTHGLENGLSHWPSDAETLVRMGRENLNAIENAVGTYSIAADFVRTSEIGVATEPWHVESMEEDAEMHRRFGQDAKYLTQEEIRAKVHSPTYLGGLMRDDVALVDPARLCWGLRMAAESLGASVFEGSGATEIDRQGLEVTVKTAMGSVRSRHVIVATNAYRNPIRQHRRYVIPVYDHVLMTEPLSPAQMSSIGWEGREGLSDVSNQFHYYRLTEGNRILWGGYDATYHWRNGLDPRFDQSNETHSMLASHFFKTFPQLEGLHFTHRWGGPIGTTTRFTAAWGTTHNGLVTWVAGYTGLGVGASRFGARVALDLAFGHATERTELEMVRKAPFPFPPEPLRWSGVQMTRGAIQRADRKSGKRGLWLGLLDKFGIGFDS